jgi:hypothetical protein
MLDEKYYREALDFQGFDFLLLFYWNLTPILHSKLKLYIGLIKGNYYSITDILKGSI